MILFVVLALALTLLAIAWLVRPLLGAMSAGRQTVEQLNAEVYREHLAALAGEHQRGELNADQYEAARDELQLRLLDESAAQAPALLTAAGFWSGKRSAVLVALLLPLVASGMYLWLGNPAAIDPAATRQASQRKMEDLVAGLAAKLKAQPDNPKGWVMLARSYRALGREAEAVTAYAQATALVETDPDLLIDYADALAVAAGNDLSGQPLELINRALKLDPRHPNALMLSGAAAFQGKNYARAVTQWQAAQTLFEPGSPEAQQIGEQIEQARTQAGLPARPAAGAASAAAGGKLPPIDPAAAGNVGPAQIAQMVERLAQRLQDNPNDPVGWARLARAYKVLGRLPEAEQAFVKVGPTLASDADLLVSYADLLAMRADGRLEGKPLELINQALKLNPRHPLALRLAGTAAFKRNDFAAALSHWEQAQAVLEPGSRDAEPLAQSIAQARQRLGSAAARP